MEPDELLVACQRAREFAKQYPITKGMIQQAKTMPQLLMPFSFMYGKYCVGLTYETHRSPPCWHAYVSVLEDIGEMEWGVPQQGMPATGSWKRENERDADKILRELLAPMDKRPSQTIRILRGNMSLHYILDDDEALIRFEGDWTAPSQVIH